MRFLACVGFILLLVPGASAAAPSAQQRKLEAGKTAIARLRKDARRRKYRDGWEAVQRELDGAVRLAPTSSLAPEAALWAARARAELYESSRSPADVRAAVAAYRKVDETYPGSEQGLEGLTAAVRLGTRAHEHAETGLAARRLAQRYGKSPEARAALSLLPAPETHPVAPAKVAGKVQRPVTHEGDEDEDPAERASATARDALLTVATPARESSAARRPSAAAVAPGSAAASVSLVAGSSTSAGAGSSKAGPAAAAGKIALATAPLAAARSQAHSANDAEHDAESEVDVPREAARVIEQMVQEARAGHADKIGSGSSAPASPQAATESAPPPRAGPAHSGSSTAGTGLGPAGAALEAAEDEPAAAAGEAPPEPEAPEAPPQRTPTLVKLVKDAVARVTQPEEDPDAATRARELRSTALAGGGSIAAQLGLKVRRVVIDPGHGGKDTGAIGPHGVREKDIALAIAKRLAARLRVLGFTALLTRKDDTFLALDERTRIANEAKADLFVSIHCNAARKRTLSGVETWTLNVGSDRYSARLAAFENAEAERTVSDLRLILADLATKANAGDARELAQSVQSSLVRGLRSRVGKVTDHGTKQALFYVLLGTHMPSILVETAFLSNPSEEARLRSARYQEGAAESIARGVKDFVDGQKRLALAP